MTRQVRLTLFAVACVAMAVQVSLSGCSLIGLGIGRMADAHNTHPIVPAGSAVEVKPGALLVLGLADGSEVRGSFERVEGETEDEYRPRYERWLEVVGGPGTTPRLGDSVQVAWAGRELRTVRFLGFVYRALLVAIPGQPLERMLPYEEIDRLIGPGGAELDPDSLARLDAEGRIASRTEILLRHGPDVVSVPIDQLREVTLVGHGAARKGFFIGLAIDVAVVTVVVFVTVAVAESGALVLSSCAGASVVAIPEVTPLPRDYDRVRGRLVEPAYAAR